MRHLFTGDSITAAGRHRDPRGIGTGYVELLARELAAGDPAVEVANSGVDGNRVGQLLARVDGDVLAAHRDVVTVLIGVNDTLVAFYEGRPTPDDAFARDLAALFSTIAAAVPRVIVLEPFYVDAHDPGVRWGEGAAFIEEHLGARQAVVRETAERVGATFVPLQARFEAAAEERGSAVLPDGVHPSPLGDRVIADAWREARG